MPRGSRIVDQAQIVQNVEQFLVAYNGEARSISEGYVAEYGIIRQFWPPTVQDGSAIVLTTDAEESYAFAAGTAKAICNLDVRTGRIELSDGDKTRFIQAINPTPRGAGNYLWKFDINSGTIDADDPTGVWVDVFSEGTLGVKSYSHTNAGTVGKTSAQGTITIAEDNGAGAPVPGTEVAKVINFVAEVTSNNLIFTTNPWSLQSIQYNEDASCIVLTVPKGWVGAFGVTEDAFITGNEQYVEVIREIYAAQWGLQFQVKADVVAGSVTGDATGVWLSTDVRRAWELKTANQGDNLTAVLDISITDGISTTTKQVTMNSQYIVEGTPPGGTSDVSDDFTGYNIVQDFWREPFNSGVQSAAITFQVNVNGTISYTRIARPADANFPQDWNVNAPTVTNPNEFECRLLVDGDPVDAGSSNVGEWLNCSSARGWSYSILNADVAAGTIETKIGDWTLEIREVGRPETMKSKPISANVTIFGPDDDGNGGPIP